MGFLHLRGALTEGAAIEDFKRPDRIVVGTQDENARRVMRDLYRPLFINETPMPLTDRRTADLIKYASNAYLATKMTFINEIANLCEAVCGPQNVVVMELFRETSARAWIAPLSEHSGYA